MAADNPFRDTFEDCTWAEFGDADSIFANTAMTKGNNAQQQMAKDQGHVMNMHDMKRLHRVSSSQQSRTFIPPLPSADSNPASSAYQQALNDDFWNELISSGTTPSGPTATNVSKPQTPVTPQKRHKSVVEQASYSPFGGPQSASRRTRSISSTTSLSNPCDLEFGIQLNEPQTPGRSASVIEGVPRSKQKKRSKPKRKRSKSRSQSVDIAEGINAMNLRSTRSHSIQLRKLDEDERYHDDEEEKETHRKSTTSNASFTTRRRLTWSAETADSDTDEFEESSRGRDRRCSYDIEKASELNGNTLNVSSLCNQLKCSLFEIGHIIDMLKGKEHGWALQKYLDSYSCSGVTSPIFEISHPEKGTHLIFGLYPRMKEATKYLKYHPIIPIVDEYGIDTVLTPIKYTAKSGFSYELQGLITAVNGKIDVKNLDIVDEEYSVINKEFHRQCEKLFDKILYGKGVWKRIPGVDSVFITHWNTFMRKYRSAIEACYLHGDLKGYSLLVCLFWSVVLRFKKENRCKDLSKVLSIKMSQRMVKRVEQECDAQHSALVLVSLNLLFRPNGIFQALKENGWKITCMDEEKIGEYRKRNDCKQDTCHQELNEKVQKAAKHAGKVMGWSRNRESCLVM